MAGPLVVHVLPREMARGSQVYARQLRDALDGVDGQHHRLLTLFGPAPTGGFGLGIPPGRARDRGFDPRVPVAFRRWVRRHRPAVVVTHGGEALLYVAPVLPRRTKLLHLRIGISGGTLGSGVRRAVHNLAVRRADVVGGVSQEVLDEAHRLQGVPLSKLRLLLNGRDPDRFVGGPGGGDTPRLAFVGHVTATKRPDRFVEVVERLRRDGLAFDAVLAGDGPMLGGLRDRALRAGIDVLGAVDDVPGLLARCDVVCFTSVPTGEGMPGVLIEAGLCCLPVVSTEVPGARTVIADGETGVVVGVDDLEGLVAATAGLLADADRRARMGAAARRRCVERFASEVGFEQWRGAIGSLLRP